MSPFGADLSRPTRAGAAICRALAADIFFTHWRAFDRTVLSGVDEQGPEQLQHELRKMGVRCESLEVDQSNVDAPARILDEVEAQLGSPSILVSEVPHA